MFGFSIKKMMRNKWMIFCLLTGFIISIAVISAVPMYTDSILQRLLIKDLESLQEAKSSDYPGNMLVSLRVASAAGDKKTQESLAVVDELKNKMNDNWIDVLGIDIVSYHRQSRYTTSFITIEKTGYAKTGKQALALFGKENIEENSELIAGEYPSKQLGDDGVIEVMVSQQAFNNYAFALGEEYDLTPYSQTITSGVRFRVVGVFTYKNSDDLYWYYSIKNYNKGVIMNYDLFMEMFDGEDPQYSDIYYIYSFDYHKLKMNQISQLMNGYYTIRNEIGEEGSFLLSAEKVLKDYTTRKIELSATLWILLSPVVLMLVFYIFMISTLIMEYEKNDISLLKSRGASNFQVFVPTAIQTLFVAGISLVIGSILGYFLVNVLGLSNGFLEVANRKALDVQFNLDNTYLLSVSAIIFAGLLSMFIPAIKACKVSIVEHKRNNSKINKIALWKKIGLDLIILALAFYALYSYNQLAQAIALSNSGVLSQVTPLLFLVNTMLILGFGLVFLRIFPFLVKLIFWLGKKVASPQLYASLLNISRSNGKEQFIVLFLIFTISLAMFNATTARTLNTFMEDRVSYTIGADMVLTPSFPSQLNYFILEESEDPDEDAKMVPATKDEAESNGNYITSTSYTDIPTKTIEDIEGVLSVARVYQNSNTTITRDGKTTPKVQMMSIVPTEFAEVAWMRKDLLPYHINEYLNLLAEDPRACLLSSSMKNKGFNVGDKISISWNKQPYSMDCVVYGFVDYWPSFNPVADEEGNTQPNLVVTNFSLFKAQMRLEPYDLWVSVDEAVEKSYIYEAIGNQELAITELQDTQQSTIEVKNDPMLQGINGTLTLSFVVTLLVTLIGFLVFWIINIKERTLQFGILRAMGLSKNNLVSMIIFEQLIISGGAIIAGVIIGNVVSDITVPMLQSLYAPSEQVPPFKIYMEMSDYIKIFVVIGLMIVVAVMILAYIINKIKMDQALKLGED